MRLPSFQNSSYLIPERCQTVEAGDAAIRLPETPKELDGRNSMTFNFRAMPARAGHEHLAARIRAFIDFLVNRIG